MPLPVLEESTAIFRRLVFSVSERKQIPNLIYEVLEREYRAEEYLSGLSSHESDYEGSRQTVTQLAGDQFDSRAMMECSK